MVSGKTTVCSLVTLSLVKVIAQPDSHAALGLLKPPKGTAPGVFQGPFAPAKPLARAAAPRASQPEATGPEFSAGSSSVPPLALATEPARALEHIAAPPLFSADSFSDIQQHWAKPFVELLAAKGILSGYGDGTFQPDAPISDIHFSLMVEQARRYEQRRSYRPAAHNPGTAPPASLSTAQYNIPATMAQNGIRTRAQAAVFIYRSLDQTEYTARLPPATLAPPTSAPRALAYLPRSGQAAPSAAL